MELTKTQKYVGFGVIIITIVTSIIFYFSNKKIEDQEDFILPSNVTISSHLDYTITVLKLFSPESKIIILLQEFSKWLKKNPDEELGLNSFPKVLPNVVVNTYYRSTGTKPQNAELLTMTLNKIATEVFSSSEETKENYQNYVPQRLQQFDAWLEDDYPRRKRFDIAMKGQSNIPTRIVVTQIINEFTSTNKIPLSETKGLKNKILNSI